MPAVPFQCRTNLLVILKMAGSKPRKRYKDDNSTRLTVNGYDAAVMYVIVKLHACRLVFHVGLQARQRVHHRICPSAGHVPDAHPWSLENNTLEHAHHSLATVDQHLVQTLTLCCCCYDFVCVDRTVSVRMVDGSVA